ncbi:MAG TPA: hypothetical protein VJR06_09120 [Nitrososphaerales archaeon]|nr:hypothetical protein [Nitrososphaerales archaeon]
MEYNDGPSLWLANPPVEETLVADPNVTLVVGESHAGITYNR